MIALAKPSLGEAEFKAALQVLQSGMLVQGPYVRALEDLSLTWLRPDMQGIAVSNGTAALHLALLALEVKAGDAVLLPTYSWPATANVVELVGARPLFVDIEEDTYNISVAGLEEKILNFPMKDRLKALIVVHAFGAVANMPAIAALAERHNLPVIEDAACALGSSLHDINAGCFGRLGCFSFHPRKIVTTGEGGMIAVTDTAIARMLRALRNHGQDGGDFIMPGFNYRMTDLQAALGVEQLKRLPALLAQRRLLAGEYNRLFADTPVTPQKIIAGGVSNYQSYVVRLPESANRGRISAALGEAGIASNIGTYHIPLTGCYAEKYGFRAGDFPATDRLAACSLALPLHSDMNERDIAFIKDALLSALAHD